MKSKFRDDGELRKAELCPKWISLLTMEKACSSTISLEGMPSVLKLMTFKSFAFLMLLTYVNRPNCSLLDSTCFVFLSLVNY